MRLMWEQKIIHNFETHWSQRGVSHLSQTKLVNRNQILGEVADQNYIAIRESVLLFKYRTNVQEMMQGLQCGGGLWTNVFLSQVNMSTYSPNLKRKVE